MFYNEKIETMPREQMEALQNERLRDCVRRVYDHVAPYRARMDAAGVRPEDIRDIHDLKKLPFTVKQDLRDNYPYGMFAVPMEDVVRVHASSGTTGKQTVVGYTAGDLERWKEIVARTLTAAGATKKDVVHISYGYGLFTGGLGAHGGAEKLGAVTVPVSVGNTKRQITIMQDFGSTILCCTPSYALYLAETMEEMGIDMSTIHLKSGCFGAEPWTEQMRQEIERRLHLSAHDIYGLSEIMGPGVSFECDEKCGLHINEDYFIPEIVDPETGEPLPDGEEGELVFTCITKEAFPLLRYRTRDICILNAEKCKCGRTHIRMTKPLGRSDDMLIVKGVNVFPSQIETVLMNKGYPANYQIVVDRVKNSDTIEIRVEMTAEMFSDNVGEIARREKELVSALKAMLGIYATVKLVNPKAIERSEGKAVRIIDKRNLYKK